MLGSASRVVVDTALLTIITAIDLKVANQTE